jgi:hypothetical protein
MLEQDCSRAFLRHLVARQLEDRGAKPVRVKDVILDLRTALPGQRLNDAELAHLIAEAAARRTLALSGSLYQD